MSDFVEFDSNDPDPHVGAGGRVHNWRNYVRSGLASIWSSLTAEQRVAIQSDLEEIAGDEEWD